MIYANTFNKHRSPSMLAIILPDITFVKIYLSLSDKLK